MKKKYVTPKAEFVKLENVTLFAASMRTDDMKFGGKVSDYEDIIEADVNDNNWNIW